MKHLVIGIVLLMLSLNLYATTYRVRSAKELNQLSLVAGDRVLLEGEEWKSQKLIFKGQGTEDFPIILTVDDPGEVVLTGSSSLVIDGTWLVVDGLSFKDGYTLKENVISFSENSENCRLTNTSIIDYNNPDIKVRNSWIVLYGVRNRVDHCYIEGKTHVGTTIGIYVSDQPNYHRIDHNYFAGRPPLGRNGGEIIRMGTDQWSMHDSYSVVEENLFINCDGEIEIISNKSTNNTIRNNLFYESKGMLTLRHGNKASVYGNYFIGNQKEGTGGIRIIGEDHKIYNNYFQGLTGTGLNATITFMNAWENPPLHGYWQVKNTEVSGNTIVDCTESIVIGSGKDEKTFLPPLNTLIADNIILCAKGPVITWTEPEANKTKNIKFDNNIVFGTQYVQREEYPTGIEINDPKLKPNLYGVLEKSKKTKKGLGTKMMNNVQKSLFAAENIGPNWMQLEAVRNPSTPERTVQVRSVGKDSLSQIKVLRNLRYGDKPAEPYAADTSSDRLLDLFLPASSHDNVPVILFVHGGGFAGGDKSALENFWFSLASEGFAVISANYRLYLKHHKTPGASASANMSKGLPKTGQFHPELQVAVHTATEDITQVLAWIIEKQDKYNLDLDRVALSGGSAGAMTALYLAYGARQNILPLQAVVNLWGGLQDVTVIQKGAPPLLTFHGDQDKLIHVDYAHALDRQMKAIGAISEMHILEGEGHAIYRIISADYIDTIVSFLREIPKTKSF